MEVEHRVVAAIATEVTWVNNLLYELSFPMFMSSTIYCDNVGVLGIRS